MARSELVAGRDDLFRSDRCEPSVLDPQDAVRVPNQRQVVGRDQAGESVRGCNLEADGQHPLVQPTPWRPEIAPR